MQELLAQGQQIQIKVDDPAQASAVLTALPWVKSVKNEEGFLIVDAGNQSPAMVSKALAEHNIFASELSVRTVSLESVFLLLTGGEKID